ncbi:MAG: hypothetical protein WC708_01770 [Lentisphaeria bacterium]
MKEAICSPRPIQTAKAGYPSVFAMALAVLVGMLITAGTMSAAIIDIINPGFEAGPSTYVVSGWTATSGGGGRAPTTGGLAPHTGTYWGFLDPVSVIPASLSQILKVGGSNLHVNAGDQITVTVYQGLRPDMVTMYPSPAGDQILNIRLWADAVGSGTLLTTATFGNATVNGWDLRTCSYTAGTAAAGHDLYVEFQDPHGITRQIALDDVSAVYTAVVPEPGLLCLLGLGGSLLWPARRNRKQR